LWVPFSLKTAGVYTVKTCGAVRNSTAHVLLIPGIVGPEVGIMLLVILVLPLLFGGGGGYSGHSRWGLGALARRANGNFLAR
jgi:hypothetical protein